MFRRIKKAIDELAFELSMDREVFLERIIEEPYGIRIDLSNLRIKIWPRSLDMIPNLVEVNLNRNLIDDLPDEINRLNNLKILDISHNRLQVLNYELAELTELEQLLLSNNQLVNIPSDFSELEHLKVMDISYNKIKNLHADFSKLQNLTHFRAQGNQLSEIPSFLSFLQLVEEIDLSYNNISNINAEFNQLLDLTTLILSNNRIGAIPSFLSLPKLKLLDLSNNPIRSIFPLFPDSLETLLLNKTKLSEFPSGILSIPSVKADHNPVFAALHEDFSVFLKKFFLECQLLEIELESIHLYTRLVIDERGYKSLDLSNLELTDIPVSIFSLISLRELNVSNNKLKSIPQELYNLTKVEKINLSNNQLTEFLFDLSRFSSLSELTLSNNQLTEGPRASTYSFIKSLDLRDNQVIGLVDMINFVDLQFLKITNNPISKFPSDLSKLRQLQEIHLDDTQVETFENDNPFVFRQLSAKIR
ncbi:MAG: leucine-rich repeat domain-containing protein [Candidatus Heimdallarchaeota archaeon]|nr:leucine-rich repeat domain-containing protein [Candidatus Heimdallarchaeota archaeon]